MTIDIRVLGPGDRGEYRRMRRALWHDCPDDQQVREMDEILGSDSEVILFAQRPEGGLCGFLEAAIRPGAEGCGQPSSVGPRARRSTSPHGASSPHAARPMTPARTTAPMTAGREGAFNADTLSSDVGVSFGSAL